MTKDEAGTLVLRIEDLMKAIVKDAKVNNFYTAKAVGEAGDALEKVLTTDQCDTPEERDHDCAREDCACEAERARMERDAALVRLEEREHDMHLRVRAGYDKTIADTWRAEVAKVTARAEKAERDLAYVNSLNEATRDQIAAVIISEADRAEKAERERDEARAELVADSKRALEIAKKLTLERNEAQADAADAREILDTDRRKALKEIACLREERDAASVEVDRLTREIAEVDEGRCRAIDERATTERELAARTRQRDEARALFGRESDACEQAIRERDAARAEMAAPQPASATSAGWPHAIASDAAALMAALACPHNNSAECDCDTLRSLSKALAEATPGTGIGIHVHTLERVAELRRTSVWPRVVRWVCGLSAEVQ